MISQYVCASESGANNLTALNRSAQKNYYELPYLLVSWFSWFKNAIKSILP
jgi:hypothetical protein